MYDQFGTADPNQGFGGGAGGPFGGGNGYYSYSSSGGFDGFGDFGDLGDIFSSFFSGGFGGRSNTRHNNGPKQGADLRTNLDITFEESFLGTEKQINLTRNETCPTCHGEGARPGTKETNLFNVPWNRSNKTNSNNNIWTNANCKTMYKL